MILVELLEHPSIERQTLVAAVSELGPSWMDSYVAFLSNGSLLMDAKEAEKVRRTSACFWLSEDKRLYWCSYDGPYLLCLHTRKTAELLTELHKGVCGGHSGGRTLAHRAMTQGFWWPNMQQEVVDYVRRCDLCQMHALLLHQPGGSLNSIASPWPFAQWGLD